MGCGDSRYQIHANEKELEKDTEQKVEWKILPSRNEAIKKFQADGSLGKASDPGQLELRTMLDDASSQAAIFNYAKNVVKAQEIFMCWVDIQDFKGIPVTQDQYRRSKALHIYHKYIKLDAALMIGDIDVNERDRFKLDLGIDRSGSGDEFEAVIPSPSFYDKVQNRCFMGIYHNVYLPFKQSSEYINLTNSLAKRYNYVRLNDFEYFGKLGEGGFGFVVHCRKKTTGKHYAMKLQTKKGLIECFSDDPWRADFEKQAFATCQHPFIVNLDYAFQTESLAIMVLGLATAGDLQKALSREPLERLSEERVRFYGAEIVLALGYLHEMGLMYRDLKPNNVLLNEDGHIQLVDLGGVADESGSTLGQNTADGGIPLLTQAFKTAKNASHEKEEEEHGTDKPKLKRKLSIMGTFGYMAPEMVIMLNQSSGEKTGYTFAIDWWSLGITLFKLLTGYRPFTDDNFNTFVEMATTMNKLVRKNCDLPEYAILFQEVPFPDYISPEAKDLISKLLDVDQRTRLGSGPNGTENIKKHPFFKNIDWNLLELKQIDPPYRPRRKTDFDNLEPYPDFESLMLDFAKEEWMLEAPPQKYQKYFANWNFTAPQTVRIESGLSRVMEQYDRNRKVQMIMGEAPFNPSTRR